MRMIYSENEPIEKHPDRQSGDSIVVINRITHLPEIAWVKQKVENGYVLCLKEEGNIFTLSPYTWEIAWP